MSTLAADTPPHDTPRPAPKTRDDRWIAIAVEGDGAASGIPDPATKGPDWILLGTEGGGAKAAKSA